MNWSSKEFIWLDWAGHRNIRSGMGRMACRA